MSLPQNLPPALAVGALYDSFLQAALRHRSMADMTLSWERLR